MQKSLKRSFVVMILAGTVASLLTSESDANDAAAEAKGSPNGRQNSAQDDDATIEPFLKLLRASPAVATSLLTEIGQEWPPNSAAMLLEVMRFSRSPTTVSKAIKLLQKQTGQSFDKDFNEWHRWIWKRPYAADSAYAKFKSQLYSRIDPRFAEYFQQTENALIRLDEIRWGGVKRDGIPPLKNPKMIAAKDATFLADTDVVFGVQWDGDVRCYPKRILAWHEMFKDTIGGVPVCGAY